MNGQWIKKRTCGGVGENKVAEKTLAFGSVFVGGVLPSCLIATCLKNLLGLLCGDRIQIAPASKTKKNIAREATKASDP